MIGVGAGRDHNADTGVASTSYRLDLTDTAPAHLDLAFRWLRDVADGSPSSPPPWTASAAWSWPRRRPATRQAPWCATRSPASSPRACAAPCATPSARTPA
uniref:Uncharacterized protein n=1 Tax=Phenylobacterium glaciei TaxID=2803784 RepID=A0A974P457_9CAUL|nr:hypothetical protein JKL49_03905 [Phenylobacterium glaciei]